MKKVLQRVNDVRIECEQAMTSIEQYKELCSRYHENTLFLFQLLAESIAEIHELKEVKKEETLVEVKKEETLVEVKKEERTQPIEEHREAETVIPAIPQVCERMECYDKQIAALESTIHDLQQENDVVCSYIRFFVGLETWSSPSLLADTGNSACKDILRCDDAKQK